MTRAIKNEWQGTGRAGTPPSSPIKRSCGRHGDAIPSTMHSRLTGTGLKRGERHYGLNCYRKKSMWQLSWIRKMPQMRRHRTCAAQSTYTDSRRIGKDPRRVPDGDAQDLPKVLWQRGLFNLQRHRQGLLRSAGRIEITFVPPARRELPSVFIPRLCITLILVAWSLDSDTIDSRLNLKGSRKNNLAFRYQRRRQNQGVLEIGRPAGTDKPAAAAAFQACGPLQRADLFFARTLICQGRLQP